MSHFGPFLRVSIEGEKFNIGFFSQFFLGVPIYVGKSGKNFGTKSQC